jgi:mycothiol synthase
MSPPLPPAEVAGLVLDWRPLTMADDQALHALIRASEMVDAPHWVSSVEEVRHYMHDPEIELPTDSLGGFLGDGRLACWAAVKVRRHVRRRRAAGLWGGVHPELRRRGLGAAVLRWSEERGRERLATFHDRVPRFLEAWSDERWLDRRALFTANGYEPIRYYHEMRRPLSEPIPAVELAAGLRFETWRSGLDDELRLAHNEAFSDHWGSEPLTTESWHSQFVGSPNFRRDLTLCVLDGDQIAGYCLSYHAPHEAEVTGHADGWLGQIGVRRPWRKRGVATAIICRVMSLMAEAGLDRAALGVDSDNQSGALRLYERLGFFTEHREIRWAKAP